MNDSESFGPKSFGPIFADRSFGPIFIGPSDSLRESEQIWLAAAILTNFE